MSPRLKKKASSFGTKPTNTCFVVLFQQVAFQTETVITTKSVVTQLRTAMTGLCAFINICRKKEKKIHVKLEQH